MINTADDFMKRFSSRPKFVRYQIANILDWHSGKSPFHDVVRQFICVCRLSRKMRGQYLANFVDGCCQRVAELLVLKMDAHFINGVLPELIATPLVDRHITNNSEFLRSWRYKNQHCVARAGLVHSQPLKFLLRNSQWVAIESSPLNENAYLAGSFRFRIPNRVHNPVMI